MQAVRYYKDDVKIWIDSLNTLHVHLFMNSLFMKFGQILRGVPNILLLCPGHKREIETVLRMKISFKVFI